MLKDNIIDFCKSLGLDTVGFIRCRSFDELRSFYEYRLENNLQNEFEEKDIERRINPKIYMEEGKTIISIAFPYLCSDERLRSLSIILANCSMISGCSLARFSCSPSLLIS